ncbi:MAG: glycosyltransferase [candidate division WOR-3 bacterium]
MYRIAILISSRKGGHKFPAEAIARFISSHYKDVEIKLYNLLDIIPLANFLDKIGRWGDLNLRAFWRTGYSQLSKGNPLYASLFKYFIATIFANKSSERKIKNKIGRIDLILSFQPEVNVIGKWLKRWFGVPLYTMIMDYSSHIGWSDESVDHYYVVNEIVHKQLIEYDVPEEKIEISGAPPQSGFEEMLKTPIPLQRKKLNLVEDLPTVLVMAGYLGKMVDYEGIIKALSGCKKRIQILVVVGRNYPLYQKLQELKIPDVHPFYNVPSIHEVMWPADLVISKPGGMVIADALSLGKPMVLIDPKAGSLQERIFAEHIEKQGAGIHLRSASEVKETIERLFEEPALLKKMSDIALNLGLKNRQAAERIAQGVVDKIRAKRRI